MKHFELSIVLEMGAFGTQNGLSTYPMDSDVNNQGQVNHVVTKTFLFDWAT